jgi:hypothetical protein
MELLWRVADVCFGSFASRSSQPQVRSCPLWRESGCRIAHSATLTGYACLRSLRLPLEHANHRPP